MHVDFGDPKIVFQSFSNIVVLPFGDLVNEVLLASRQEDSQKWVFFSSSIVYFVATTKRSLALQRVPRLGIIHPLHP
jgi:hypothetical protein